MNQPSELELMMFFDGELEEPRRSEVEAFVVADSKVQAKLTGLEVLGVLVREHGDVFSENARSEPSDVDLTQAILARVEKGALGEASALDYAKAPGETPTSRQERAVRKLEAIEPPPASQAAANDNGRFILGLAAVAAAAAAALFVWGRTPEEPTTAGAARSVESSPMAAQTSVTSPTVALRTATSAAPVEPVEEEPSPAVEVASVDFGSRTGAIYYMSGESKGPTTTVVWVSDD